MNVIYMIMALFFGLAILFGGHYFIYYSLVRFFGIDGRLKTYVSILFMFLPMIFILASILVHWYENIFTETFYMVAGVWLGLALYMLLSFIVLWILYFILSLSNIHYNFKMIAMVAVALSLVYTSYGIWNAFNLRIEKVSIKLDKLPENWKGKKIVHISDVHLGVIYGQNFINKVVKMINQIQPEAVMITGDYFDGMDGILKNLTNPLDKIKSSRGVYYITGNHETYLGVDKVIKAFEGTNTRILNDEAVDIGGLHIVGISYPERGDKKDLPATIKDINPGRPAILLYHAPVQVEAVADAGIDLMLSGHTHQGQLWPFRFIINKVYGRYGSGLENIGDFWMYTSSGVGTWGPPIRTESNPKIVEITLE